MLFNKKFLTLAAMFLALAGCKEKESQNQQSTAAQNELSENHFPRTDDPNFMNPNNNGNQNNSQNQEIIPQKIIETRELFNNSIEITKNPNSEGINEITELNDEIQESINDTNISPISYNSSNGHNDNISKISEYSQPQSDKLQKQSSSSLSNTKPPIPSRQNMSSTPMTPVRAFSPKASSKYTSAASTRPATSMSTGRNSIFRITSIRDYDVKLPSTPKRKMSNPISSINDKETFRLFINGYFDNDLPHPKQGLFGFFQQNNKVESFLTHEEVSQLCDRLLHTPLKKIKRKFDNPSEVRDVIDELNRLKIEAITQSNYTQSKKINDLINFIRNQHRLNDRESIQKERIDDLKRRLDDTNYTIKETTTQYVL